MIVKPIAGRTKSVHGIAQLLLNDIDRHPQMIILLLVAAALELGQGIGQKMVPAVQPEFAPLPEEKTEIIPIKLIDPFQTLADEPGAMVDVIPLHQLEIPLPPLGYLPFQVIGFDNNRLGRQVMEGS